MRTWRYEGEDVRAGEWAQRCEGEGIRTMHEGKGEGVRATTWGRVHGDDVEDEGKGMKE